MNDEDNTEVAVQTSTPNARVETGDGPKVGEWFWVKTADHRSRDPEEWFACATHVGSNYVELHGVTPEWTTRVHFDDFWQECRREPEPQAHIDAQVKTHQTRSREIMRQIADLTRRLHVAPTKVLPEAETQALSVRSSSEPVEEYKKALIHAEKKELPELFDLVKRENEAVAQWMKADLLPLQAELDGMRGTMGAIKDRIFSVELYAGLVETVAQVKKGNPAALGEPLHLMQRRHYMDEECLVDYQAGGMEFENIRAFERWLAKKPHFERIFPFPRCAVAFRVRREEKERNADSLLSFIQIAFAAEADKSTFLYIRNGDQLHRLRTEIDFGEKLFPDLEHRELGLGNGKLWGREFAGSITKLITEGEYRDLLERERKRQEEAEKAPKEDRWRLVDHFPESRRMRPFSPEDVHFDDMAAFVNDQIKEHNRLVLILQGLLDRSPVLHPHPPWQLWTPEGFAAAVKPIYDDSRALSGGEAPDFETYRARLNASLAKGSLTVGQQESWERNEARKENERVRSLHYSRSSFEVARYNPPGNPGPGTIARVSALTKEGCLFTWQRARLSTPKRWWTEQPSELPTRFLCPKRALLNISAYTKGDYKQFYTDPRTRADYLKWAPLLLEAEEYLAGNRKVGSSE